VDFYCFSGSNTSRRGIELFARAAGEPSPDDLLALGL